MVKPSSEAGGSSLYLSSCCCWKKSPKLRLRMSSEWRLDFVARLAVGEAGEAGEVICERSESVCLSATSSMERFPNRTSLLVDPGSNSTRSSFAIRFVGVLSSGFEAGVPSSSSETWIRPIFISNLSITRCSQFDRNPGKPGAAPVPISLPSLLSLKTDSSMGAVLTATDASSSRRSSSGSSARNDLAKSSVVGNLPSPCPLNGGDCILRDVFLCKGLWMPRGILSDALGDHGCTSSSCVSSSLATTSTPSTSTDIPEPMMSAGIVRRNESIFADSRRRLGGSCASPTRYSTFRFTSLNSRVVLRPQLMSRLSRSIPVTSSRPDLFSAYRSNRF